jgi:hypothetical protein
LGSILRAFETHDDYGYVAGDATACYQHGVAKNPDGSALGEKVTQVTRQLVFLPPHHFVIFDRVSTTDPDYRKDWLLHTAAEPLIQDRTIRADHGEGRMFCRNILPADARLTPVGGPGQEFWAANTNWTIAAGNLKPEELALMGQWRVEVTPGSPRKDDVFLHVIQVGDRNRLEMDAVTRVQQEGREGVRLRIGENTWQVIFNTQGALGGRIRRVGLQSNRDNEFTDRVQRQVGILAREYPGMTASEARQRIPKRQLPEFWIGDVPGLAERFQRLTTAEVKVLARSPGGRPMHLVSFGSPENLPSRANYNSAMGARDPSAYRDKAARKKPVILFVGPVHGHEVEALTGLVNLVAIMETGRDLRRRDQTALQALGRQCHLLIVPEGNPDGIARFEPRALQGMSGNDLRFWGQGTWSDDTFCGWPESKRQHPMAGANVGFLGCYFNDEGVNPMHDEFFVPMGPEAPAVLKLAQTTAPDLAVSLHSHESAPALLRPAHVPLESQETVRELAERCYALLEQRGLPDGQPFKPQPEGGRHPASFNLTSALHHVSGADSFTFECPHGLVDESSCAVTLDQVLDIQLTLYESVMRFALERKQP